MAFNPSAMGAFLANLGQNGAAAPSGPASSNAPATTDWNNPQAGLGQDVVDFYNNYQSSAPTSGPWSTAPQIDFNKMYRTPGSAYDPTKALQAHNGDNMPGTVSQYGLYGGGAPIRFDTGENGPTSYIDQGPGVSGYMYTPTTSNPGHRGDPYYVYNPDGSFKSANTFEKDAMSNPLVGVASVVGAGMGFGALAGAAGAGAAAAGEGAGGAGMAEGANIGAANALSDAAAYNSLPASAWAPSTGGLGSASMGAGSAGMGSAGSVFNPAVDSQLASSQLGITGSQAAADAASSAIPSVTVNGVPQGSWLDNFLPSNGVSNPYTPKGFDVSNAMKLASKAYGQMGQQQTQQAQTPIASSQTSQPGTFVSPTPGFYSIASPAKKPQMLSGMNEGNPYMSGLMRGMYGY